MVVSPGIGDRGSGPAVLLLHGQPGSASDWQPVVDRLSDRFRVIVPDRLGYGSGVAGGLVANADAAVGLLDHLGVDQVTVAGHSWGGAVALMFAHRHPERVQGVVLVSSVAHVFEPGLADRLLAAPFLGPALAFGGLRVLSGLARVQRVRNRLTEVAAIPADRLTTMLHDWRRPGVWRTFVYEQRALFREAHLLPAAAVGLHVPTTVVQGTADVIVSPRGARLMAQAIPGARFVELTGGGHGLPMERPDDVADAIAATAELALDT